MRNKTHLVWSLIVFAMVIASGSTESTVHAQQPNQVGLVIQFGNGDVTTRCIEFNESEVSGYEVLQQAELDDLIVNFDSGMGAGICSIEGEGCSADSCMTCDVPNYWSYWHLSDGSWSYSKKGASSHKVQHGDVEGWRWGDGDPPPVTPFDQICAAPTNTPVPPTDTPVPPTDTPVPPTETPQPETEDTPIPELVVWFRLDQNPISAGSCTVVRWDTTNAEEVYLDGEQVDPISSREVCPTEPQEYNLRVVGPEDEETHTLVLGVTGGATSSPTSQPTTAPPLATPTSQAATTASPSLTPSSEATATSTPSLSPTPRATSSPSPMPTLEPTATPSPTTPPATSTAPPQTPTEAAQPDTGDQPDNDGSAALYSPATYAVFALIVGGLLGWLVFLVKVRK